jgi:hypothetical protein
MLYIRSLDLFILHICYFISFDLHLPIFIPHHCFYSLSLYLCISVYFSYLSLLCFPLCLGFLNLFLFNCMCISNARLPHFLYWYNHRHLHTLAIVKTLQPKWLFRYIYEVVISSFWGGCIPEEGFLSHMAILNFFFFLT